MAEESRLAKLIDATNEEAKYDAQVKKLIANKAILAWILKTCTAEFAPYSPQEIAKCIEGEPEVAATAVHQDEPGAEKALADSDSSIEGGNTEDKSLGEGTVYYDVRFTAAVPGKKKVVRLIINVESQLDTSPGYPLEKRAVYYCCRLISAQYGTVFTHSRYGKLRKVYSIWFCPDPPRKCRNTVKKISLGETAIYGKLDTSGRNSDLIEAVIVNMGDPKEPVDNQILRLMNVLLATETGAQEKKRILQEEFNIAMTVELEQEVSELCNLGHGVYTKGVSQGISQGIEGSVDILRDDGYSDKQIIDRIKKRYSLTQEEAESYVLVPV